MAQEQALPVPWRSRDNPQFSLEKPLESLRDFPQFLHQRAVARQSERPDVRGGARFSGKNCRWPHRSACFGNQKCMFRQLAKRDGRNAMRLETCAPSPSRYGDTI